MRNPLFLTITLSFITVIIPFSCFAEEKRPETTIQEILEFKNPFTSLLPKKEIIKPRATQTTVSKTDKVEEQITLPELLITGLVWNSNRPQAIVNEQIVGIGDTIDDVTITNIEQGGIEILYQGKHFTINPNEQTAKSSQGNLHSEGMRRRIR